MVSVRVKTGHDEKKMNYPYRKGLQQRQMEPWKKETAFKMKKRGYSDATIADLLDVGINVIQQWLSGSIVKL